MNDTAYAISTSIGVLSHFPLRRQPVLRDTVPASDGRAARFDLSADSDTTDEFLTQARVKSGDYFATLATELDKLAQSLSMAQAPEAPALERMVPELLYLDKNYMIRRKKS